MKYLTSGRMLFSALFVVVFALLIVTATSYNPKARTFPLIVAVPVLIGAIANLVVDFRIVQRGEKPKKAKTEIKTVVAESATTEPAPKKEKLTGKQKRNRELIGTAWLIGYVAALILFGFNLATLVYLVAFIKFFSKESWTLTIIYTVVLWAFVYVAFVVLLKSNLAPGLVFEWLAQ